MLNYSNLLALAGSLCMDLALLLAWCLVGVRSSSFMKLIYPEVSPNGLQEDTNRGRVTADNGG